MLNIHDALDQKYLDKFISLIMNRPEMEGWAFIQVDVGKVKFPIRFVIVPDYTLKAAVVHAVE